MLKIRSTPTDSELKAQTREWSTETDNAEFHIPAIPYGTEMSGSRFLKDILYQVVSHYHFQH